MYGYLHSQDGPRSPASAPLPPLGETVNINWRFRVPEGETITFTDRAVGPHTETAGRDFGDFLVWRKDDLPSYQYLSDPEVERKAMGSTCNEGVAVPRRW